MDTRVAGSDGGCIQEHLARRGLARGRSVAFLELNAAHPRTALATLDDGSTLFIKHASTQDERDDIHREAEALRALSNAAVPALIDEDEARGILVVEALLRHRSLSGRRQLPAIHTLRLAAAALATLHGCALPPGAGRAAPSIVTVDSLTPRDLADHPAGYRELARRIFAHEGLAAGLRGLAASASSSHWVHGDAKLDNVLVGARVGRRVTATWIDLELAGAGDPAMDLGFLLGDVVHHWLAGIPTEPSEPLASSLTRARWPFAELRRRAHALLEGYGRKGKADATTSPRRVVAFAGAFLVGRALANVLVHGALTPFALVCLHVARSLVVEPGATRALVGDA
jgi:aminoglycoside phosphotransferase (APT) family kinase protein